MNELRRLLKENDRRLAANAAPFDPVSGKGSVGERELFFVEGLWPGQVWLPSQMMAEREVAAILAAGSCDAYIRDILRLTPTEGRRREVRDRFERLRILHDFPYWATSYAMIKRKGGGEDVPFILNRPQRRLVETLETERVAGRPIRLILLKARQWGGSTCCQLYMAWLQLVHSPGLNSLIIAHQTMGSDEIKDMFDRLISSYPLWLLHEPGARWKPNEKKLVGVGRSGAVFKVPQRNCKVKVGTAERPDSCRGGDYNLVHCSEIGVWKATQGKTPEQIVRSACSGILLEPMTMIVYESTANGTGNYFQREYEAARRGESQFRPLFVSWFEIDQYTLPLEDRETFGRRLLENRLQEEAPSDRCEPGRYLWWLWERGATLEAIAWYETERRKYSSHGMMASEYPSDDIEAFVNSGARVFDLYAVERLRGACRAPRLTGEAVGDFPEGERSLKSVRFERDSAGSLWVWQLPDGVPAADRYLAVVDVGGRSAKADWSVIVVFDRLMMADGGRPVVVAQWRGHCDIDLLAWKAARIAALYDNALLVVESNTMETREAWRMVEGDQSEFILSQIKRAYPNLYARRRREEEIREGRPLRYGFHTNVSTKPMIISSLVRIVREGLYVERDARCLDELMVYERRPDGSYGAVSGHHDDLVMTRAIGLHICFHELPLPRLLEDTPKTSRHSLRHPVSGTESTLF